MEDTKEYQVERIKIIRKKIDCMIISKRKTLLQHQNYKSKKDKIIKVQNLNI